MWCTGSLSDRHIVAILEDSTNPNPALVGLALAVVVLVVLAVAVGGVVVVLLAVLVVLVVLVVGAVLGAMVSDTIISTLYSRCLMSM